MITRKRFIYLFVAAAGFIALIFSGIFRKNLFSLIAKIDTRYRFLKRINTTATSEIYISKNGTPQQNITKVIEMAGGIEKFIEKNDIIVLKPNAQWWNQGRTNLAAIKGFIDLVHTIPEFNGEIIIAENNHFMDDSLADEEKDNVRGWTHFSEINGDIDGDNHNLNTLIEYNAYAFSSGFFLPISFL